MKRIAEDFKDQLAGSIDKVAAVKLIKSRLKLYDLLVKTTRRKLASGYKIYFHITNSQEDKSYVQNLRHLTKNIICVYFPNARITSACSSNWTIAEY